MIRIGSLLVNFEQRSIQQNGLSRRVGARAFDILEELYRAEGAILSKDEIMDNVWPGQIVEENCIHVHIASLRKLLGADRDLIKTVPGRGYLLVVRHASTVEERAPVNPAPQIEMRAPPVSPLIGRDAEIEQLINQIDRNVVTTVVGAGGIGKTALALHVANVTRGRYGRSVCVVDLTKSSSDEAVLAALADALKVPPEDAQGDAQRCTDALFDVLAASQCLLVLDNAEHVIDAVAHLVETLVSRIASARVLVTSREALHIRAESVLRLEPLCVPESGLSAGAMLEYSAVDLFLSRARSLATDCATDGNSIAMVADICRRLDGLPLAIELAAARVATLGVEGVASRLDDRLNLLTGGLRSALPRHQTLRATFEWSYGLLDEPSRVLFRRLGCFTGTFMFDAAFAIATEPGMSVAAVVSSLGELAKKSLLNVMFDGPIATYRLTKSTRAYALEKLHDEGEFHFVAARHMRYMKERIEENGLVLAEAGRAGAPFDARLSLDDVRTAYDWAFSENGDPAQGVAFAGALVGTLLDASLLYECCERARHALTVLETLPAGSVDALCEMRLCAAYASTLVHVGDNVDAAITHWQRVLRLAQQTRDDTFAARALWGLWNTTLATADVHASLRHATRFEQAALRSGSNWKQQLAGAMVAISLHCFGEHEQARARLEEAVTALGELDAADASRGILYAEPRAFCNCTLARIAWLQGKPAQAMQLVESSLDPIRRDVLEPSLSHLLAVVAVPVALQCGDLQAASCYLALLRSQVASHRFAVWEDYAECLAVQIDFHSGEEASVLARLEPALQRLAARGLRRVIAPFIVLWAEALARAGRFAEAGARLDAAIACSKAHGEHYFVPELLRAKGCVELQQARAHDGGAPELSTHCEAQGRRFLNDAMALASEHGASIWELRAALDLATHLLERNETIEAAALVSRFDGRFDLNSQAPDIRSLAGILRRLKGATAASTHADALPGNGRF
ncbi:winged helix-turn-helix domain-containing protein [Paraburkholderia pallida]|uniref:Transcriptional regulator n=1 Tax=Paraburkholderia pallida TaxID=2547399 RepID=A0A4P7CZZ2_9BURK|nr:winged helix-turn-helix domain-containing protein [Paraburkholderia pallida]QBR01926.1 transcriptional regulator [Paraburkholderia pallida]